MSNLNLTKTKILISGAVALAALLPLTIRADYPSTVLSQSPVGYYRLSETAPIPDVPAIATNLGSLGTARNGTVNGGLSGRGATGAIAGDTAMSFNGSSQYVEALGSAALAATNFSFECWFTPVPTAGNFSAINIMSSAGNFGASLRRGWYLQQQTTTNIVLQSYNGVNATATLLTYTNSTPFVQGQFYHLVFNRSNITYRMYVNGVLVRSGNHSGYTPPLPTELFSIGSRANTPGLAAPSNFWPGKMDEVAFYTNILSADQIAAHYAAASTNTAGYAAQIISDTPSMYYRLNEPILPTTVNSGSLSNAANASLIYPAVSGVVGPRSPAFPGFDGSNVGLSVAGSLGSKATGGYASVPSLTLNTNAMTITCWLKPNGGQAGYAGAVMLRTRVTAPNTGTSAGLIFDAAGGLDLSYNWDGDDATHSWASGQSLVDSAWNFAALIVQPDQAILYVPGNNPNPSTNIHTHAVLTSAAVAYLGTDAGDSGYNGVFDEVAIFRRALSVGEVYSQYASAVGGLAPRVFENPAAPAGNLYVGDTLKLGVDAGGSDTLSYQWRADGTDIIGANAATYSSSGLSAGTINYDVVVANSSGSVTSSVAAVTVTAAISPVITQNILVTNRTVYAGGAINLSVVAQGGGVGYVWQLYGTNLPGRTNATLSLDPITNSHAGPYQCVITNSAGTASSYVASIAVAAPAAGSYDALVATDGPRSWWRMDDAPAAPLMLDAVGRYDGAWSNTVTLGVTGALTNNGNKAVNLEAGNQGWGEVTTLPPPGANGDFTIECWVRPTDPNSTESIPFSTFRRQYGFYFQKAANSNWRGWVGYGDLDTVNSRFANIGPVTAGQWTHLAVTSAGGSRRYYFNGRWDGSSYVDIARNLNTPMRIGALDPLNQIGFSTWFSGDIDEVAVYSKALSEAQLFAHYSSGIYSTNNAPVFARQPQSLTIPFGNTATFTTIIEGSPTIGQQWYRNGTPIAGATTATLTIANASYADAIGRTYQCIATNIAGTTFSTVVTLTVIPKPTFANLTNNLVLHLKFDGDYLDTSGKGHHATPVGSPTIAAGKVGSGAILYGTSVDGPSGHGGSVITTSYATLGTFAPDSDLSFSNNVSFSLAYWVKIPSNSPPTTTGDLPFLCSAVNSLNNPGLTFANSYNGGGWAWTLGDGVNNAAATGVAGSINNGSWHHLVHTFDRVAGQGLTYLDGALVSTVGISAVDNIDAGNTFNIGQDPTGLYTEGATNYLDDLGIWKGRVLTANEAYATYYVGNLYGRSYDAVYPITMELVKVDGNNYIVWQAGTLQWADAVSGPYTAVPAAAAPYYQISPIAAQKYFRVQL